MTDFNDFTSIAELHDWLRDHPWGTQEYPLRQFASDLIHLLDRLGTYNQGNPAWTAQREENYHAFVEAAGLDIGQSFHRALTKEWGIREAERRGYPATLDDDEVPGGDATNAAIIAADDRLSEKDFFETLDRAVTRPIPAVDPELERLLAEEEEIEQRHKQFHGRTYADHAAQTGQIPPMTATPMPTPRVGGTVLPEMPEKVFAPHGTHERWNQGCRCGACENAHYNFLDRQDEDMPYEDDDYEEDEEFDD